MPFIWVQNISVGASVDAADLNEVKTNLDTIYTALSITKTGCASGAGWVELPVSAAGVIQSADFQELRAVTDYAYDNRCPVHDVADNSGVDTGDNSAEDNNDHGTYNSPYDSGVLNDDHGLYQSAHDAGYDLDDHGTYQSSYHTGYCTAVGSK